MYYKINSIIFKKVCEFEYLGSKRLFLKCREKLVPQSLEICNNCPQVSKCDNFHTCIRKNQAKRYKITKLEGILKYGI